MLTSELDMIKTSGVLQISLSDHYMNYLIWKSPNIDSQKHNVITFRKSKGVDWNALCDDLRSLDWNEIESIQNLDDSVSKWEEMILITIDKHMPFKTKRMRKKNSPWMTETIFQLIKDRDKAKNKALRFKNDQFWKDYKKLRNEVTACTKKEKKAYRKRLLAECTNRNNTWKVLKSFLPRNDRNVNIPCEDDSFTQACVFNDHFSNVATNLLNANQQNKMSSKSEFKAIPRDKIFEFSLVSEVDVMKEIKNLKNKKSVGIDGISIQVLKSCGHILGKSITYFINQSISQGRVPRGWKIAKVIPLHKKGDKSNPDNYRPISLLPCISKIMERIIQRQLLHHLQENNILDPNQSGFRPKHSTTTALIKVTDEWLLAMDEGMYTGAVFVDLRKAFDLVDHKLLLMKLSDIGLKDTALKWFESYLSERRIVTTMNKSISNENILSHGVPQGSILGPLLFSIFINDLPRIFKQSSVHLYADDTVIYFSHKNVNNIQTILNTELKTLDDWMHKNNLLVNYTKTVSMIFGTRYMLSKSNKIDIKIKNNDIELVESFKYLGIQLDRELKWDIHIDDMCQKIGKLVGFLGRLSHTIDDVNLNLIYKATILPHFDYGELIWQSASKSSLLLLQKLQNRAGRMIMKINPFEHVSTKHVHDSLSWEFLEKRQDKHLCIMMYKILHNLTPVYMSGSVSVKDSPYDLRSSHNLNLPRPNTNSCKRTFFYRGISKYNTLPQNIRDATSLSVFKLLLNEFII